MKCGGGVTGDDNVLISNVQSLDFEEDSANVVILWVSVLCVCFHKVYK